MKKEKEKKNLIYVKRKALRNLLVNLFILMEIIKNMYSAKRIV